jgi:predicted nuclease of predicted toxin-antitoxin system
MNIWIDAQLPPTLASWLNNTFEVNAMAQGKIYNPY